MEDILWSDPSVSNGRFKLFNSILVTYYNRNSRGAGVMFGPDVTLSFLKDNQLELVVRSHELQVIMD